MTRGLVRRVMLEGQEAEMARSSSKFEVRKALAAARDLAANPDDLPKVFTIIEALSGNTYARVARRMATTESGRRLLQEQPDVVKRLEDRAALARMPEGSLGRAYLAFVESENISPAGISAADDQGRFREQGLPAPLGWVHARLRDTHDLWHPVAGYKGDVLGEVALLAFTFAQTRNPGIALMVGVGLLKLSFIPGARRFILDGYRRGKKAAHLPSVEWEALLEQPLTEVRARLSVDAPPVYRPVRSAELRQPGAVAST